MVGASATDPKGTMKPPPEITNHNQRDIFRITNALNDLHIPLAQPTRETARILRSHGHHFTNDTLWHAIRMRRALHLPPL